MLTAKGIAKGICCAFPRPSFHRGLYQALELLLLPASRRAFAAGHARNPFDEACLQPLPNTDKQFYNLHALRDERVSQLPFCIRILLEAAVRNCDGLSNNSEDVERILDWKRSSVVGEDVPWKVPRVVLQDLSGIPALMDLSAMRDSVVAAGGNPQHVNPLSPVDLVVDHSIIIDVAGVPTALQQNEEIEFERNRERFEFLKWAQQAYNNMLIVPPGSGIIHQVNCEYLSRVVMEDPSGIVFPDGCVGTDSHTPMVNGVGVIGWGVGGIEAESVMLGQPVTMVLPEVVGFHLTGELRPGVTGTDLVLTVTHRLRKHGVTAKFVEFYGDGAEKLAVTTRMTVANMCPEYGATIGFFPIDDKSLEYLRLTGRSEQKVALTEAYMKAAGLFGIGDAEGIHYSSTLSLDLGEVEPSLAGPKRPMDLVPLSGLKNDWRGCLTRERGHKGYGLSEEEAQRELQLTKGGGAGSSVSHGALSIAAITSCTNTSNPSVLLAAGLLAKKAVEAGLRVPGFVKTSLAPGSRVVSAYLEAAGLQRYLDQLGFHVAGYGCTTCMGNSGEVDPGMADAAEAGIVTGAILSGNRNFEARVHPSVGGAYLASPPLVVAGALAGSLDTDFQSQPLGRDKEGKPVFLRDVWPSPEEIDAAITEFVRPNMFQEIYGDVASGKAGSDAWKNLEVPPSATFNWDPSSTYIMKPPFLEGFEKGAEAQGQRLCSDAYCLLLLGDSVTTDHISPVFKIKEDTPAGRYLKSRGVAVKDLTTFGARRGSDAVMTRGTFYHPRLANTLVDKVGPWTVHHPSGDVLEVCDAAERYRQEGADIVVVAGAEYGTGSSRDWAAKGTRQLGIRAVLAKSFERIHRSNLCGMGVVPLAFLPGEGAAELGITGLERFSIDLPNDLHPGCEVTVRAYREDGAPLTFSTTCRLDTAVEVLYYRHGGVLPYVLNGILEEGKLENAECM